MISSLGRIVRTDVFTKQELDGLVAFHSTPSGQAFNSKQPVVQEKMMAVMMPLVIQGQQEAQQQMRTFVTELRTRYGTHSGEMPPSAAPSAPPKP